MTISELDSMEPLFSSCVAKALLGPRKDAWLTPWGTGNMQTNSRVEVWGAIRGTEIPLLHYGLISYGQTPADLFFPTEQSGV